MGDWRLGQYVTINLKKGVFKMYHQLLVTKSVITLVLLNSICIVADSRNTLQFVSNLQEHFGANCIYLRNSHFEDLKEQQRILPMVAYFTSEGISSSVVDLRRLLLTPPGIANCIKPLVVVYGDACVDLIEISTRASLSRATWLMIVDQEDVDLADTFNGINIPFDCEFIVARGNASSRYDLTEVYRVAEGSSLQQFHYGSWTLQEGVKGPNAAFYSRRNDLQGITLKSFLIDDHSIYKFQVKENGSKDLQGYFGDIWGNLMHRMNFKCTNKLASTEILQNNRSVWEMPFKMMEFNTIDVFYQGSQITHGRMDSAVFTLPVTTTRWKMYVKKPGKKETSFHTFLAPFSTTLWIGLLVCTFTATVLVALTYRIVRRFGIWEEYYPMKDAVFCIFGAIFCQQGHAQTPSTMACRIIHLFAYILGLFVMTSYSGILTSMLAVFLPNVPFTTLQGLYDDGSYELGTMKNTNALQAFEAANDSLYKNIFTKFFKNKPKNVLENFYFGFTRVCQDKFALIAPLASYHFFADMVDCDIIYFAENYESSTYTLAFAKNSPYLGLANHILAKMVDAGIIEELDILYTTHQRKTSDDVELQSIDRSAIRPLTTLMILGIILSIFIFILELVFYHTKKIKIISDNFTPKSNLLPLKFRRKRRVVNIKFKRKTGQFGGKIYF